MYDSQKVETTQVTIHNGIKNRSPCAVEYYSVIEKEWGINAYYNVSESQKHSIK
jgi:hypothetical protein